VYVVKRVWKIKPREGRLAATIAKEIGDLYVRAGRRSDVRVYFNTTTMPGKRNRMYMEWTAETLESPYRGDLEPVPGVSELGAKLRDLTTDTWIEIYELMTPDKAAELT
jgi:hypothetical protein